MSSLGQGVLKHDEILIHDFGRTQFQPGSLPPGVTRLHIKNRRNFHPPGVLDWPVVLFDAPIHRAHHKANNVRFHTAVSNAPPRPLCPTTNKETEAGFTGENCAFLAKSSEPPFRMTNEKFSMTHFQFRPGAFGCGLPRYFFPSAKTLATADAFPSLCRPRP